MVTVAVFQDFADAAKAIDELVVERIPERAINVIASAKNSVFSEVAEEPDMGRSGGDAVGSTNTLHSLLLGQSVTGIPDAGDVLAAGEQAYDIVRHTSATFESTASLGRKLSDMGMSKEEADRTIGLIRGGGIMMWITDGAEYPVKAAEIFSKLGALLVKPVRMPLPQER